MAIIQQFADFLECQEVTNAAIDFPLNNLGNGGRWTVATYVVVVKESPTTDVDITLVETLYEGSPVGVAQAPVIRWMDSIPAGSPIGTRAELPNGIPLRFNPNAQVDFKVTAGGTGVKVRASLAAYHSDGG
jgi:hypothetical protein